MIIPHAVRSAGSAPEPTALHVYVLESRPKRFRAASIVRIPRPRAPAPEQRSAGSTRTCRRTNAGPAFRSHTGPVDISTGSHRPQLTLDGRDGRRKRRSSGRQETNLPRTAGWRSHSGRRTWRRIHRVALLHAPRADLLRGIRLARSRQYRTRTWSPALRCAASRSHAAQHITAENVCTSRRPRNSQITGSAA